MTSRLLELRGIDNLQGVVALRARLSHSFLDHDVLMVDSTEAVERHRAGEWAQHLARIRRSLDELKVLCESLALFSAGTLVPVIPHLKGLTLAEARALRESVDLRVRQHIDSIGAERRIAGAIAELAAAIAAFEVLAGDAESEILGITRGWSQCLTAARGLRGLFDDGTIPRGLLLP